MQTGVRHFQSEHVFFFSLFCEIFVKTRKTELCKHIRMTFLKKKMNGVFILHNRVLAVSCAIVECCWYFICYLLMLAIAISKPHEANSAKVFWGGGGGGGEVGGVSCQPLPSGLHSHPSINSRQLER